MRIAIAGGVFGRSTGYRSTVRWTPETTLLQGLTQRGHDVTALPHAPRYDLSDFDVAHVHHLSWGAVAAATDRSSTPFVFSLHATAPAYPRAARFVMSRADGIVALWPGQAETFGRRFGAIENVAVIPNGIDPSAFSYTRPTMPRDGSWELLYVGQLIPGKGVEILLRAIGSLRRRHDVRLSLVYHTNAMEGALQGLAQQLRISDVVRFRGHVPQQQLASVYARAHFLVLPSTGGFEALPSVLTEGMYVGTFPIGTDVGGVRDQVRPYGIVVRPGDVGAFADGIERAIRKFPDHVDRAEEMSEAARTRFSIDRMIVAHEELYERVTRDGQRPRRHDPTRRVGTFLARPAVAMAAPVRGRHPADGDPR